MEYVEYESPVGTLFLVANAGVVAAVATVKPEDAKPACRSGVLSRLSALLDCYFSGENPDFSAIPFRFKGTDFQCKVWKMLQTIPYGKTLSYKEVAQSIGCPRAVRAVGGACHANRLLLLVPCHRVLGADGSLTGFGGGLAMKKYLLALEKLSNPCKPMG